MFRTGLFENPYLNVAQSVATVGKPEYMTAGYEAQLKSLVLLKNQGNVLPLKRSATVYIPQRRVPESEFFGNVTPARDVDPINLDIARTYFHVTNHPDSADAAVVVISSPASGTFFGLGAGYDRADVAAGGNGYVPISLQYGPYTATHARATSLAGGDPLETFTNRSYRGKTATVSNGTDLKVHHAPGVREAVIVVLPWPNRRSAEFGTMQRDRTVGVQTRRSRPLTGAAEPSGLCPSRCR
jgi:beta-glucosidase